MLGGPSRQQVVLSGSTLIIYWISPPRCIISCRYDPISLSLNVVFVNGARIPSRLQTQFSFWHRSRSGLLLNGSLMKANLVEKAIPYHVQQQGLVIAKFRTISHASKFSKHVLQLQHRKCRPKCSHGEPPSPFASRPTNKTSTVDTGRKAHSCFLSCPISLDMPAIYERLDRRLRIRSRVRVSLFRNQVLHLIGLSFLGIFVCARDIFSMVEIWRKDGDLISSGALVPVQGIPIH
ncbi:hypothetical protein BDZ45DRAFT_98335 [Acephala macrosclerotiorum]|nr:hypothetical protein BDZ45DRAFT_98335 [Acephala macrosclerotiorum]